MKYFRQLFCKGLIFSLLLGVLTMGTIFAQWSPPAELPPAGRYNEVPLYGGVPKNAAEKRADDEFLASIKRSGLTRKEGAEGMIKRGWGYFGQGQPKLAIRRFNQAWLLDPTNYQIYWGLAASVRTLRDYEAAIKLYNKARKLSADQDAKLLCDFGRTYNYKGDEVTEKERGAVVDKGIELFSKAAHVDPKLENIYSSWAIALDLKGDYQGAWKMIDKAKKLGGKTIDDGFIKRLQTETRSSSKR